MAHLTGKRSQELEQGYDLKLFAANQRNLITFPAVFPLKIVKCSTTEDMASLYDSLKVALSSLNLPENSLV